MLRADLEIWEFADAPQYVRELVPATYWKGWIAIFSPGARDVADLVAASGSSGQPVFIKEVEGGGVVLAGSHIPEPGKSGSPRLS